MSRPRHYKAVDKSRLHREERIIAGKKLVTAISREGDSRLLAREPTQEMSGQQGRVSQRFVEPAEHGRNEFSSLSDTELALMMLRADVPGNDSCWHQIRQTSARRSRSYT